MNYVYLFNVICLYLVIMYLYKHTSYFCVVFVIKQETSYIRFELKISYYKACQIKVTALKQI